MRLLLLAAGRRSKFLILALAIVFAGRLASQAGNLESVVDDDPVKSLPQASDSKQVAELVNRETRGDAIPALIVAAREGGLSADDRAALDRVVGELRANPIDLAEGASPPQRSQDGSAAIVAVPLRDSGDEVALNEAVKELRERLGPLEERAGLQVAVTGGAAFSADLSSVFDGIDGVLLIATATLVLVLLILIYRSPIFWLLPFITVIFAEGASRGAGYLLGSAGLTVTGQSSGILSVLVFGAATDYALLLVSRYREELHRIDDVHEAMAAALRGAAPAILASGGTVVVGLLTLTLADVGSTQAIGPLVAAARVAISMVLSLTLLPVTLVLGAGARSGPPCRAPSRPPTRTPAAGCASASDHASSAAHLARRHGRAADLHGRARHLDTTLTQQDQFTTEVEAVEGQRLISQSFPSGLTGPATVLLRDSTKRSRCAPHSLTSATSSPASASRSRLGCHAPLGCARRRSVRPRGHGVGA